jgi:hypothetical protein
MTWQKNKDECKHGHPFTPENTRIRRSGARSCIECGRIRSREYQRKKRAETKNEKEAPERGNAPRPELTRTGVNP